MLQGLNSAAAGMAAQRQRMDAVSNDLANVNTTGYKRVRVGFADLVYQQAGRSSMPGPEVGAGARAVDAGRSFQQGVLQRTDNPLHVAIQGEGFLRVRLPDGRQALTRDGTLQVDGARRLVTSTGALLQPQITLPAGVPSSQVSVQTDGTVTAPGGRNLGRIAIVTVRAPQALQSAGGNAFVPTAQSGAPAAAPRTTTLASGVVEASNVDVAEAMVSMIEAQRSFQLASRAISTADQMMEIANGVKRG